MTEKQNFPPNPLLHLPPLLPPGTPSVLPRMVRVRQHLPVPREADPGAAVAREWRRLNLSARIRPGARIGIAVGSRGIGALLQMVIPLVEGIRAAGGLPVIIPAMGSHGGATPEGQVQVLQKYGIDPSQLGCECRPEMDTETVGTLAGNLPVYIARAALEVDGLVILNRVKAHTSFRGPVESGLVKMLAIGLGKHLGALTWHAQGMETFGALLPEAAELIMTRVPLLAGFAVVENAREEPAQISGVLPETLVAEEKRILQQARHLMARILLPQFEVLIVDTLGKDISGAGMDPNVTGRFDGMSTREPDVQIIVALGLSGRTGGNANGVGGADVITRRLLAGVDYYQTYVNAITAAVPHRVRLPLVAASDQEAILLAMRLCKRVNPGDHRVVRIRNTLELYEIMVSESLLPCMVGRAELEVTGPPRTMDFDTEGNLYDWSAW